MNPNALVPWSRINVTPDPLEPLIPFCHWRQVPICDLLNRTAHADCPLRQQYCPAAQTRDRRHIVAYKQDCAPFLRRNIVHLSQAFLLEARIPDCQNFINYQDFRLKVRSDGKGQTNIHPGTVALDWCVEELLGLGKGNYLIELGFHLGLSHSENSSIQINVLAPGEVWVESTADLQK